MLTLCDFEGIEDQFDVMTERGGHLQCVFCRWTCEHDPATLHITAGDSCLAWYAKTRDVTQMETLSSEAFLHADGFSRCWLSCAAATLHAPLQRRAAAPAEVLTVAGAVLKKYAPAAFRDPEMMVSLGRWVAECLGQQLLRLRDERGIHVQIVLAILTGCEHAFAERLSDMLDTRVFLCGRVAAGSAFLVGPSSACGGPAAVDVPESPWDAGNPEALPPSNCTSWGHPATPGDRPHLALYVGPRRSGQGAQRQASGLARERERQQRHAAAPAARPRR